MNTVRSKRARTKKGENKEGNREIYQSNKGNRKGTETEWILVKRN